MSYPGSGQYDPYGGGPAPHQYAQQQGQQQYGQQPNYGGGYQPAGGSVYGGLGAFSEPPKKNRTPIMVLVAAVVAAAAGVGVYFAATSGDDEGDGPPPNQAAPPSNTTSAPAPTTTTQVETSTSQAPSNGVTPVVPDWQVVLSEKEGVAFDVSGDWEVHTPTTILGYEDDAGPRIVMHGAASYRDDFCAGESASSRAIAGFQTAGDADPKRVPPIAAKLWATAAAEIPEDSDKVKPSEAKQVEINGGQDAWMATATVQIKPESACDAEKANVTAVAFRPKEGSDKTALFILVTDEEVDNALPEDEARKVIGSLRPVS